MCMACLYEYTDKPVINDRVTAAADLMRRRGDSANYSALIHLIVEDMNVDDHWFDRTSADLRESHPQVEQWEWDIYDALSALTEPERATAVALEWGYDLTDAG